MKIGDYIKYKYNSANIDNIVNELNEYSGSSSNTTSTLKQEQLNWRVLDIKDGNVRIISEIPTASTITLFGVDGYNNAVYLIDKVCNQLYNSELAVNVQNLKLEDIIEKMTTTAIEQAESYQNKVPVKYGQEREYKTKNLEYPTIYENEKDSIIDGNKNGILELSQQQEPIIGSKNASTTLKVRQTYWYKDMLQTDFNNEIYYNIFISNEKNEAFNYWLSTRCVHALTSQVGFDIRRVNEKYIGSSLNLCNSARTGEEENTMSFRPVITLKRNVTIENGDGLTPETAYEII